MRKHIKGEWLLALAGIASVLFALALLFNPAAGALALVWVGSLGWGLRRLEGAVPPDEPRRDERISPEPEPERHPVGARS